MVDMFIARRNSLDCHVLFSEVHRFTSRYVSRNMSRNFLLLLRQPKDHGSVINSWEIFRLC